MSKNYAVRLRCPYGDDESWVILEKRSESLEQILLTSWDFECNLHGAQREFPLEAREKDVAVDVEPQLEPPPTQVQETRSRASERRALHVPVLVRGWCEGAGPIGKDASRIVLNSGGGQVTLTEFRENTSTILINSGGALVSLAAKVHVGDVAFLVNKISTQAQEVRVAYVAPEFEGKYSIGLGFDGDSPDFWSRTRQNERVRVDFRVVVRGNGSNPFVHTAQTVDISRTGALLDGVGYLVKCGTTVEVERRWHGKAHYRVVWVGQMGTEQSNHVGLVCLDAEKNIWDVQLPEAAQDARGLSPSKKSRP